MAAAYDPEVIKQTLLKANPVRCMFWLASSMQQWCVASSVASVKSVGLSTAFLQVIAFAWQLQS